MCPYERQQTRFGPHPKCSMDLGPTHGDSTTPGPTGFPLFTGTTSPLSRLLNLARNIRRGERLPSTSDLLTDSRVAYHRVALDILPSPRLLSLLEKGAHVSSAWAPPVGFRSAPRGIVGRPASSLSAARHRQGRPRLPPPYPQQASASPLR